MVWLIAVLGSIQAGWGHTADSLAPSAYVLTLDKAIDGNYPLTLYLAFDGQECRRSFATTVFSRGRRFASLGLPCNFTTSPSHEHTTASTGL
jgi:hypothetical protein